ncbi:cytidine deaminase [Nitratireductor indicus C115]|uniref:Cytidine deaminase n=1 Tax=Nitratireductor indicus C115 TaxID=1231190 RepID=K2PST2_9HYPH|nr:cytidine deaminase [Nitratireductor indicus]EKF44137.1 cytidine deaminase [Nitratireductor indicus C115]SFQ23994.1 cytidine deaminase [Nitratireductor indicus]
MSVTPLFSAARNAMDRAYAPYSRFPVGAALKTETGAIHAGCNIENASFPEGWCAETSALSHLVMAGGGKVKEIAVVAEKMPRIMPCGGCRQRLSEFVADDAVLHLCDLDGVVETVPFSAVFPLGFTFEDGK